MSISIQKNRTDTIVVPVNGLSDWTYVIAKLTFAKQDKDKTVILTETGTIDNVNNIVTFDLSFTDTELFDVGAMWYEFNLFKMDKSLMKTPLTGIVSILPVIVEDPNVMKKLLLYLSVLMLITSCSPIQTD